MMSQLDVNALQNNFEGWRKTRAPEMKVDDAFERYVVEAVFKDVELSDEEITSGLLGGGNDGGVDGAYFVINDKVMQEDTPVPINAKKATLWLIQAKNQNGFKENVLSKFSSFVNDMLDFTREINDLPIYSPQVKDFIESFREKLLKTFDHLPEISVNFVYATRSDNEPSPGVLHRKTELEAVVKTHLSSASVSCVFLGAKALLDAKRAQPERIYSLEVVSYFAHDKSFVGIAKLSKLAEFLTDDKGNLRQNFLEPNIRDYNGIRNKVNEEIRATLDAGMAEEFWWLNNGITILANDCSYGGARLNIKTPEIVNGLQTSTEIFNHSRRVATSGSTAQEDNRTVLVRVILPPTDSVRRRIIKTTNSQTPVNELSLHANDDIHFEIEELFRLKNLYYDRRKGEYRRLMKPISQIVSMNDVAQAVIAIALHAPDDARARPRRHLDSEDGYGKVFDVSVNRNFFLNCIVLDRSVKQYLDGRPDISRDEKNDTRFYLDLWVASELTGSALPTKSDIAGLPLSTVSSIMSSVLDEAYEHVYKIYVVNGGDGKAAKSSAMRAGILQAIKVRHPGGNI